MERLSLAVDTGPVGLIEPTLRTIRGQVVHSVNTRSFAVRSERIGTYPKIHTLYSYGFLFS